MPAYSFKEQFIPLITSGEKRQTIRSHRKHQAKPGDTLFLYYGMRTKWCRKIKETKCIGTARITIAVNGSVFMDGIKLNQVDKDHLAHSDGFRHEDDFHKVEGCFQIMLRWWQITHSLPFKGDIIYW